MLAQLERHLSPITGIVSTLVPGDRAGGARRGGRCLTPTFSADHNFSDMYDDRFFLKEGLRRRSGGKGKSAEQARMSALAESLERYCGVFDGTEPRIRASFARLGKAAIHPNACMGYSERQYAERRSHNRSGQKARWVPEPFREDVEIEWTPLWSLSAEEPRYLPTSLCYYGYRSSDPLFARAELQRLRRRFGHRRGRASGAARADRAGRCRPVVVQPPATAAVDLESVDDAYVSELIRHYGELRRELWALDITSDFGVPTFAAISRRVDKAEEDIIYGFGAHLDPGVALARALTEMNQSLEAVPTATGPASNPNLPRKPGCRALVAHGQIRRRPLLDARPRSRITPSPGLQRTSRRTTSDRTFSLAGRWRRPEASRSLSLDQTRPDVGFPVVRVVAPGLRHFWARFGPGRLYDVPLREGWLPRSLDEGELNPFVVQM